MRPLLAALLLLGCAADPTDPFADLDALGGGGGGKADGAETFFSGDGWTPRYDSERQRLDVEGEDREGRYRDVALPSWSERAERVRLDRGDRLAGR